MARKILLADDSVTAQNMGRKILADAGYEVITVNNGSAALKKIGEQRPDLIVLDVYMPGYSGLEVCQRLKETGDTSRIPILLTVGKLEPFKPEEAKRARADGFIVKPFEASELLSALSKLEDKVVPRAESSKPGRFARVSAAIEESRYDRSMAVEEDSGWKSRIVFPKKKQKPAERESDDPSIYNPVNKDLRTTIEHKPVEQPSVPAQEEARVDVGALASAGLPKDVTPEEIAALAAAAAKVKGKLAEGKVTEPVGEMAAVAPVEAEHPEKEVKAETPPAEPLFPPAPEAVAPGAPPATFAAQETSDEQEAPEKIEAKEPEPAVAATPAEGLATIARLEEEASPTQSASLGNALPSPSAPEPADEPVTMAVAAPTFSGPLPSRWAAIAVATAPEESAVSLEQEMQKALAASASVGGSHTAVASAAVEVAPPPSQPVEPLGVDTPFVEPSPVQVIPVEASAPVETPASAPVAEPVPSVAEPEPAKSMSEVASAATDAISAAVAELESAAAAYVAEKTATPAESSTPKPAETPALSVPEMPQMLEAKAEAPVVEAPAATEPETKPKETGPKEEESKASAKSAEPEVAKAEVPQAVSEEPAKEESIAAPVVEAIVEKAAVVEANVEEAPAVEVPAAATAAEVVHDQARVSEVSEEPAAPARVGFHSGGSDDMAKRESETAAAWASWRRIRETGDSKPAAESSSKESEPEVSELKDAAAMAVAAGAESKPEEVNAALDSDPEIASIVDSVLADMRPKIVEEIARKLGKKK